ncbi:A-kinase anchor protein 1, mitochondrial-like [Schistocerca piceifrons]|uniref:A-kinase anchor protein 1, mitochondrial-like n=1 Tax=Schistocerca piceifrons TaxID=274613 RepID=UPI001F5FB17B|nr:A-kinase anchor protein 1, mitochondrial-like [Schistocerca piceifrons]XP_047110308.1 A-kinase anchor protein 1, mitochondrial-like [Schistocerca piceifrons]XP_047110309.1 A-kinase anchor protein 1, mitochondrial-like [Schistocerca piceifrons]XP_047110310.1 A-kinase anchor protein 1, mitochondrial-like [Schistocerca piceifrons]
MAPTSCRHTLIWSLPTVALLLTFLWYKSRRGSSRSDPGGTAKGTRKAKKQEERTKNRTLSLLAEDSKKTVKEDICSTSKEQPVIRKGSSTTGTVCLELGHPEEQQSEINFAAKVIEKPSVENTVPPSGTNFSTDSSEIISVGKSSHDLIVGKCDNSADNKNSLIELSDTSKPSCVINITSDSRLSAEENSGSIEGLLVHCDPKESNFEVKTNCEGAVLQRESSEIAVPTEIDSAIVFPPESDTRISGQLESAAESVISDPKEITYEISNLQESLNEPGLWITIPTDVHTEVAVPKETILEVPPEDETIYEVALQKETIYEVTFEKETNSEASASEEKNPDITVLQETVSKVTVPKNTVFEVPASQEINSEIIVAQETDCDLVATQEITSDIVFAQETDCVLGAAQEINSDVVVAQETETVCELVANQEADFDVTVPQEEDSKVIIPQETHFEVTVSQDCHPGNTIGDTYHSDTFKSEENNLSIGSQCSDCSRVLYSSTFAAGSEEVISATECNGAEDLPSSNLTDRHTEEDTMPEPVREDWTLEKSSDIQAEPTSETQRKDTDQTCGEDNECSQNKDSASAQSARMQTPPPVKEVSDEADTAATGSSCGLEGKLAALELGKGRDSANHSPAEVMLASPSASSYSDEGSSDSGKGCSDLATPPSRTPASGSSVSGDATALSVYEFVLPQHLVGRLIGRHGAFVHQIKAKTNASILIKRHPDTQKLKICAVEGTQLDIESALEMIRKKFPLKHYPSITLEQVCFVPPVTVCPILPECLQLMLVEGVSNDVILSSLVTPGHFFLQQPTHPTFPALNRLNACMNVCYSEPNVPLLPSPVDPGVICAAPTMGGWYRAQIVSVEPETNVCEVKFVDYGGYLSLEHTALRQIRSDFMTLPFQASECFLANVIPTGGEEASWSADAAAVMEELTHGQVLQAQVCDYTEENIPNVFLYAVHCNQVVLVNQELVLRGLAEWWKPEDVNDVSCV